VETSLRHVRRARGARESEVLAALWASETPMTPEEVRQVVGDELAYTTVLTILVRLQEKGAVTRAPRGRGFAYAPILDDADLVARRMRSLLDAEVDRDGVLSRFASSLEPDDAEALRAALRKGHEA
jgi:predicted transcriptional regulator